jgi:uncharacterized protein (DUF2267 family)
MADEPERMEDELRLLRERRHRARCTRSYSLFLEKLGERSDLPREQARRALVSVLCALERPLRHVTADDPRAWLPLKLQEAFQGCPLQGDDVPGPSGLEALLQRVEADIGADRARAESVTRAVLATLRACITEGEAQQVSDALPADMRALWARAC